MEHQVPKKPETKFKERVVSDLRRINPHAMILKTQERTRRGVPDLWVVWFGGRSVIIELKIPGENPDALQQHNIVKARAAGALAFSTDETKWALHKRILAGMRS